MNLFSRFRQPPDAASGHRLSPAEFVAHRADGATILDVRTAAEYRSGHVAGARNLDGSAPDFRQRAARLDRNGVYYLYCRSGSRSEQATQVMRALGFEQAYNVGGIDALAQAGVEIAR
jgi:phage shock protein E